MSSTSTDKECGPIFATFAGMAIALACILIAMATVMTPYVLSRDIRADTISPYAAVTIIVTFIVCIAVGVVWSSEAQFAPPSAGLIKTTCTLILYLSLEALLAYHMPRIEDWIPDFVAFYYNGILITWWMVAIAFFICAIGATLTYPTE